MTQYPHHINDKLVFVTKTGSVRGKRVGKDCPLTRDEIRAYVKRGTIACVRTIKESRGCSLKEAVDLLCQARGARLNAKRYQTNSGLWYYRQDQA